MENTYLGEEVAKPLSKCLQELVEIRPMDPIEWIAHWLYKYVDNELYYIEKARYLKELLQQQEELEKERKRREARRQCLENHLMASRKHAAQMGVATGADGEYTGEGEDGEGRRHHGDDGASSFGGSRSSSRRGDKGGGLADKHQATWTINCQWGLICKHPVLGDIEPRPPLVYPETPEWWDLQGYVLNSLYDHEIYSRDNDDFYPGWDELDHMSYKELVQDGPWLSEGALRNMHPSLKELYQMPDKAFKHKHKRREGDREFNYSRPPEHAQKSSEDLQKDPSGQ